MEIASTAVSASSSSLAPSARRTRAVSCMSSQPMTSFMVPPLQAAASRMGARILAAAPYQKSALSIPAAAGRAARTSQSAVRWAPCQVRHSISGVQPAPGMPVLPVGSYTHVCARGSAARALSVSRRRSVLTEVATTGPCHSRMAGMAKPVVLPVWVGPITIADWRDSAATRWPSTRPRLRRPGSGADVSEACEGRGRAPSSRHEHHFGPGDGQRARPSRR